MSVSTRWFFFPINIKTYYFLIIIPQFFCLFSTKMSWNKITNNLYILLISFFSKININLKENISRMASHYREVWKKCQFVLFKYFWYKHKQVYDKDMYDMRYGKSLFKDTTHICSVFYHTQKCQLYYKKINQVAFAWRTYFFICVT